MGPVLVFGNQFPFPRRGSRNRSSREPVESISNLQDRFPCVGIGQQPGHLPCLLGPIQPFQGFIRDRHHRVLPSLLEKWASCRWALARLSFGVEIEIDIWLTLGVNLSSQMVPAAGMSPNKTSRGILPSYSSRWHPRPLAGQRAHTGGARPEPAAPGFRSMRVR
jgi:hypothetical protein